MITYTIDEACNVLWRILTLLDFNPEVIDWEITKFNREFRNDKNILSGMIQYTATDILIRYKGG